MIFVCHYFDIIQQLYGNKSFPRCLSPNILRTSQYWWYRSSELYIFIRKSIDYTSQSIHFSNNFKVKISRGLLKIHSRISNSRLRAINSIFCCSQNKHFLHLSPTFFSVCSYYCYFFHLISISWDKIFFSFFNFT